VTQLRARGARVVGKTNMDEFGMGSHSTHSATGPTINSAPKVLAESGEDQHERSAGQGGGSQGGQFAASRSAGGSSGGSAVAVARGEADLALGTDTGGSVRLPAAYTGVVGFKPSYGMLSRYGVVPYANSLDTVGLLAEHVGSIADLILGGNGKDALWPEHDSKDPTSMSAATRLRCERQREGYRDQGRQWNLQNLSFGLPLEYNISELEPCIRDAWIATADLLRSHGASVVAVSLPTTRQALSAYYVIAPAEASSNLAKYDGVRYGERANAETDSAGGVLYANTRDAGFGDEVKRRILLGAYSLSSEAIDNYFIQAQKVRQLVRQDFDRVFALQNPLLDAETGHIQFDTTDTNEVQDARVALNEMPEGVLLQDKLGPAQVDFLLCPTAPTLPPTLEAVAKQAPPDAYMNDVFTVPASLAGLPAISIPLPVAQSPGFAGLQLIGQYWDDARLLGVADALAVAMGTLNKGAQ
jgi:aspartyl-tRNA(Asn)/glutamyl-tRNA(Gln) amidotransferase subunit A